MMFTTIYNLVLPYLKDGNAVSPVAHTNYVIKFATELAEAEELNEAETKRLVIAAILHDSGICRCMLPKIVESDVIRNPMLKQAAIDCRIEHMEHGIDLAREILQAYGNMDIVGIDGEDFEEILRLVGNHDNYKLTKYEYDLPVYTDKLMLLLNEADVLWMLTLEGIDTDIRRGSGFTIKEQVIHNLKTIDKTIKTIRGQEIADSLLEKIDEQEAQENGQDNPDRGI